MKFRFSPIKDRKQLFKAIEYVHFKTHELCKKNLGILLPVAGNIGVFCHFADEFEYLTNIRKQLTNENDNWNQKYFRLNKPIVLSEKDGIPETKYTYLYIRKPDIEHPDVGDADFYMKPKEYKKLKQKLISGDKVGGVEIFDRPDLDLIRLYDYSFDVASFIGQKTMEQNVDK